MALLYSYLKLLGIWAEIFRSRLLVAYLRREGAEIGREVFLAWGVQVSPARGARLRLGDGVRVDRYTDLILLSGAELEIGAGSYIGKRNIISAARSVRIGRKVMTAHQVTVIDSSHAYSSAATPIADQGMETGAVLIADDCWIAANSTVLRGVELGARTIVAAHSLVNRSFGGGGILGGVPAVELRKLVP